MARRLNRLVPVRVTYRDAVDLRRWARENNANVSEIIRDLIAERRRRQDDLRRESQGQEAA